MTSGVCVSCKASSRCDGGDEGILNMGDYLVTHRLLRDYLKLFTSDGLVRLIASVENLLISQAASGCYVT